MWNRVLQLPFMQRNTVCIYVGNLHGTLSCPMYSATEQETNLGSLDLGKINILGLVSRLDIAIVHVSKVHVVLHMHIWYAPIVIAPSSSVIVPFSTVIAYSSPLWVLCASDDDRQRLPRRLTILLHTCVGHMAMSNLWEIMLPIYWSYYAAGWRMLTTWEIGSQSYKVLKRLKNISCLAL